MKSKFIFALLIFFFLGVLAFFTLDGKLRIATLVFLGGFVLKMYIVVLKSRQD